MKRRFVGRCVAAVSLAALPAVSAPTGADWPAVRPGYVERTAADGFTSYSRGVLKPLDPFPFAPGQQLMASPGMESRTVIAGEKVRFAYVFKGRAPDFPFAGQLAVSKRGQVCWREQLSFTPEANVIDFGDGTWQLAFEFAFPMYFSGGRFEWGLTVPGLCGWRQDGSLPYPNASFELKRRTVIPGFERPVRCEVKMVNGAPEFVIDGRPTYLEMGTVGLNQNPDARHSDLPLNCVNIWSNSFDWHPKTNEFLSVRLDGLAEMHRRANPDAFFIWDLTVYPPPDFRAACVEELVADEKGERKRHYRTAYSFASRKAMDVMRREVEAAIRYLESSPYANRIIAYRISSGDTPEWLAWSPTQGRAYDFSKPALEGYAAWCKARYPEITVLLPTLHDERMALDNGGDLLWDRQKHLRSTAFWEYYSDIVADDCIELNRLARQILGKTKPLGTYHGYTFFLGAPGTWQHRALFAYKKVVDSGVVDFVVSPQGYSIREPGAHFADMKPFATNRRHGIVNLNENDARTHHGPNLREGHRYGQTVCEEHTVACLRRDMATELCRRNPYYYYPIAAGTDVKFPRMAEEGRVFRTLGQHLLDTGAPRRRAEIALVASERGCVSIPVHWRLVSCGEEVRSYDTNGVVRVGKRKARNILSGDTFVEGLDRWARVGAPVDYLLQEDLKDDPGDYRLYVFLNPYIYDDAFKSALAKIKARGATVLWQYAPGWATAHASGTDCMEGLTGIRFERLEKSDLAGAVMADGRFMGLPDEQVTPLFAPLEKGEVLGRYRCGKPAVVRFREGASATVFSGTWQLDVPFVQQMAGDAGVFRYCETDDATEANERLFMLHAKTAGVKHVRLPQKTGAVLDVFGRRIVALDADAFDFYASLHSTHLFYLGDDAELLLKKLGGGGTD